MKKTTAILTTLVAGTVALAGCSSGQATTAADTGGSATTKSGPITIQLIQKQGDQQYFVDEAAGAKAEAAKLGGVTVKVVNVGTDSNAAINAVDTAVAQGVDGVAIVVPDAKIGPQVADKLRAAKIPFVATDDPFKDGSGQRVPWVSIESLTMGRQIGEKAGGLLKASGWATADTRVLSVLQEDLGVCQDREKGQLEQIKAAPGEMPNVVRVGTDNSVPQAQSKTGAAITANSAVKHWVVVGCNDESVTGAVTALANSGVKAADINGVGLGAYLMCKDWQSGQTTGNRASLFVDGRVDGATSIRVLVEAIRTGTPPPATTLGKAVMVDASNWKQSGVVCT